MRRMRTSGSVSISRKSIDVPFCVICRGAAVVAVFSGVAVIFLSLLRCSGAGFFLLGRKTKTPAAWCVRGFVARFLLSCPHHY